MGEPKITRKSKMTKLGISISGYAGSIELAILISMISSYFYYGSIFAPLAILWGEVLIVDPRIGIVG